MAQARYNVTVSMETDLYMNIEKKAYAEKITVAKTIKKILSDWLQNEEPAKKSTKPK